MRQIRRVLGRLALAVLTLALLSVAVFLLAQVLPSDIARQILGKYATSEQVADLNEQLGMNRPPLERYFEWAGGFIRFDWGTSPVSGAEILPLLRDATLKSVQLGLLSFVIGILVALVGGILAAKRPGSKLDAAINYSAVAVAGVPEMVVAVVSIAVFGVGLGWFPVTAQTDSPSPLVQLHHLILPALVMAPATACYVLRIVRAEAIKIYESDYVRTAVLQGASGWRVDIVHGLRNLLSPVMPAFGANLIYMTTGMIVIERLFNYPGLGNALFSAANAKDVSVLTTGTMIAAVVVVVVNLLSDVAMVALNPRAKGRA